MNVDHELMVRSKPSANANIEEVYESLRKSGSRFPAIEFDTEKLPPVRVPSINLPFTSVALRGRLKKGLRGEIHYTNRQKLSDEASSDDYLAVEFTPNKVDFKQLVQSDMVAAIQLFGAYYACVKVMDLVYAEFETWQEWRKTHASRDSVFRVWPVSFYDAKLCASAFGLAPAAIANRVRKHVEDVSLESGGVLIVGSYQPMLPADAKTFDKEIRALLACGK